MSRKYKPGPPKPTRGPFPTVAKKHFDGSGTNAKDVLKLKGGLAIATENILSLQDRLRSVELALVLTFLTAFVAVIFMVITNITLSVHMEEFHEHSHQADPGGPGLLQGLHESSPLRCPEDVYPLPDSSYGLPIC